MPCPAPSSDRGCPRHGQPARAGRARSPKRRNHRWLGVLATSAHRCTPIGGCPWERGRPRPHLRSSTSYSLPPTPTNPRRQSGVGGSPWFAFRGAYHARSLNRNILCINTLMCGSAVATRLPLDQLDPCQNPIVVSGQGRQAPRFPSAYHDKHFNAMPRGTTGRLSLVCREATLECDGSSPPSLGRPAAYSDHAGVQ